MSNTRVDSRGAWVETETQNSALELTGRREGAPAHKQRAEATESGDLGLHGIRQLLACRRLCHTLESGGVRLGSRVINWGSQAASCQEIKPPHICTAPITRGLGGWPACSLYVCMGWT